MASGLPVVKGVVPILFVGDVSASANFFRDMLGFIIDFLSPPFYGSVSRDGVCLHLRAVREPAFAPAAAKEESLIVASFEVSDAHALFSEFKSRGAPIVRTLARQSWGGTDFHVRDIDGNVISFVTYGT